MMREVLHGVFILCLIWGGTAATGTPPPPSEIATAQDQSTETRDAEITRKIRSELMERDLSLAAKNVTVITADGKVTLRGNVPSKQERKIIGDIALSMANSVNNEIVVSK